MPSLRGRVYAGGAARSSCQRYTGCPAGNLPSTLHL